MKYNLIFLNDSTLLLSNKSFKDWFEIQSLYENYMSSLEYENLEQIADFIFFQYKIPKEISKEIIAKIDLIKENTIELNLPY